MIIHLLFLMHLCQLSAALNIWKLSFEICLLIRLCLIFNNFLIFIILTILSSNRIFTSIKGFSVA